MQGLRKMGVLLLRSLALLKAVSVLEMLASGNDLAWVPRVSLTREPLTQISLTQAYPGMMGRIREVVASISVSRSQASLKGFLAVFLSINLDCQLRHFHRCPQRPPRLLLVVQEVFSFELIQH